MFARFEIGVVGFSTILRHVAVVVGHDHAEALVVLDRLHPDDAVGVGAVHDRQVGVEDRVDEDDEHRLVDVRPASATAPAVPSCTFCSMNTESNG